MITLKKKILITGITGMLGQAVFRQLNRLNEYQILGITRQSNYKVLGAEILYGDLSSESTFTGISDKSFDAIIHCSAETNVNMCEVDKQEAYNSNVVATQNLLKFLKTEKFIFISTDSIFDGVKGDYMESDSTAPLNYYAKTKLLSEVSIENSIENYYIIRTNIYGFSSHMKNSLFEWGFKELKNGNIVNGYTNMFFNPLYTGQLSEVIENMIIDNLKFGIYNLTSNEYISKYDFLIKLCEYFNFDHSLILPIDYHNNDVLAARAMNTTLCNNKIKYLFKDYDFSINSGFEKLKNDFDLMNIS